MTNPSGSALRPEEPRGGLAGDLIVLAGTPDDDSCVPVLLRSITQFAADLLPPVSYASVTARDQGAYATVAMSSEVALAVDEAQYADQTGPCLDALETARPTALPQIDATVKWPGFRATARRLGLRASLSIPLFAGQGTAIAALNLYGHDPDTMAPLIAVVLATFDSSGFEGVEVDLDELDPGAFQLVSGLIRAFEIRATIQQALGVIMAVENTNAEFAYAILRSRAAASALSLTAAASALTRGQERQPPV